MTFFSVLDARLTPLRVASSKLSCDDAMISVMRATDMAVPFPCRDIRSLPSACKHGCTGNAAGEAVGGKSHRTKSPTKPSKQVQQFVYWSEFDW